MPPVLAYIDPGSGSLIIQALIASIVAAPFVLRRQVGALVRRIRRREVVSEPTTGIDREG